MKLSRRRRAGRPRDKNADGPFSHDWVACSSSSTIWSREREASARHPGSALSAVTEPNPDPQIDATASLAERDETVGERPPGAHRPQPRIGANCPTPCSRDPSRACTNCGWWCTASSPLDLAAAADPADTTVAGLHAVLQIAFGWTGTHLHRFVVQGREYGIGYVGGVGFGLRDHLRGRPRTVQRGGITALGS